MLYSSVPLAALTNSLRDLKYSRLSADAIVVKRCAIMIIVRPELDLAILSIAAWTSSSDFGSRAEVASSRIKIFGFFMRALAIAILYF